MKKLLYLFLVVPLVLLGQDNHVLIFDGINREYLVYTPESYDSSIDWLQSPFNATALILLFGTLYFHASSGLQVVIEDYVHHEGLKIVSLILIKLLSALLGVLSILCVLKIYL